ncbi:unnamed protein product [Mytilus coruscus]|uniref:Mab-21-like HhH/H2TH-like domain-containing protein n=1 Tax=Mytilus coruscus TaxID=42192 RepID=A0A6J8AW92_MYTCO|nr:unnamed protein product [Mytilus coruscus]
MTANRTESLHLYDYLCWKIGSDKEVKGRRLNFIAIDTSFKYQISSGSKSEGLDIKGSDIDLMFINQNFKVYESERDNVQVQRAVLIMDITDTHPCFTRLCLYTNYTRLHKDHRKVLEQHGMKYFLSNKLYKQNISKSITKARPMFNKIHGPCISDDDDEYDLAFCLKCDKWISQAVPWINRPRSSWLSPEIVNEIIMNGIQCLSASETLHDYTRCYISINKQLNINTRLVQDVLQISRNFHVPFDKRRSCILLKCLRHPSKTDLSHDIFLYFMSAGHQVLPTISHPRHTQNNKLQYDMYKYNISYLLMGLHSDAVTGWLMLASLFYVHKNYLISLDLIDYALSKFTDEKCDHLFSSKTRNIMTPKQQFALDMMKKEKLITTLKSLTITNLQFAFKSQILPKELQQEDIKGNTSFHPLAFAHFLRFLCCYHLHDFISCRDAMQDLSVSIKKILPPKDFASTLCLRSSLFVGIVAQMLGATDSAREYFNFIAQLDKANYTSASTRLRELG